MADGPKFTHLHVHTHYSLLDGATRIESLVETAKKQGSRAVAITDHGNMFGAVQFYQAAMKAGVKPIVGMEAYMAPGDRRDKKRAEGADKEGAYHLLLLARNRTGYGNLLKLSSIAYREGFYRKPRIDKEVLRLHSEGIICTSTCLGGEIPQALMRDDRKTAEEVAKIYLDIFGEEHFYIELQDHGLKEQKLTNPELADIAKRLGIGIIATNDVHYLEKDDEEAHDVLCCISTGAKLADENRFKFPCGEFYLKTPEQMHELFKGYPDAISNTERIVDLCNLELKFGERHPPVYRVPGEKTADDYLRELVYAAAEKKYPEVTPEIRERIDYELSVIASKGFSSYFLIVWDFVNYARSKGIPCGGRGSACSTVVGYCLNLSAPEPLSYELYFERFMDPDRDEMPDIDMDICQDGREEVIEYVRQKYGHVAQIVTYGTLKAKAAVKDVARVLGLDFEQANAISKLIPDELKMTIDKALTKEPDLQRMYKENPQVKRVIDISKRLEGLARHTGVHAAGVVICDQPIETFVPLYQPAGTNTVVTQYDGPTVETCGLLKMDFLGLRTLSVMERARQLAEKGHNLTIDLDKINLTDPKVFELFVRGETKGVFQFESGGMRDVLMKMKPNRIQDLIAANALYRPGPMVYIDSYVSRKHGEAWTTPHPLMTEVLKETYGILVYQEQVSRLVNRLGGIELKRAFRLAKAISKKKTSMIEAERQPFIDGCDKNGVKKETANEIFEDILRFGGYAFNKAHSTGYALVAYKTAWLKTYYPTEYMAALLTFEMVSQDKVVEYIEECKRMNIAVLPPDVNVSEHDFNVVYRKAGGTAKSASDASNSNIKPEIRFGLAAIKGVGDKAVANILAARKEGGPFKSIFDFCERVDSSAVNRAAMEALIKSGAFDSTGAMRKALMLVLEDAMAHGAKLAADRKSGQLGLFGGPAGASQPAPKIPALEWSESEMLAHEKSVLGFYVTRHPLSMHEEMLNKYGSAATNELKRFRDGDEVTIGGMISKIRTVLTKNGKNPGQKMGIVLLEDLKGSLEVVIFPRDLEKFQSLLALETLVFFRGQVDRRREEPSLRVSDVIPLEQADEQLASMVLLRLRGPAASESTIRQLRDLCNKHRGDKPVYLELWTHSTGTNGHEDGEAVVSQSPTILKVTIRAGQAGVRPTAEFKLAAESLLGPGNVVTLGSIRKSAPPPVPAAPTAMAAASFAGMHDDHDDDMHVPDEEAIAAG